MPRLTRTLLSSGSAADPPEAVVTVQSDFVVILTALLCALIAVIGLIAVARYTFLHRGGSNGNSSNPAANKGVKKKVLKSLPKFTYTTTIAMKESCAVGCAVECNKFASSECSICLGEFNEGDEIRVLPQCGHGFHVGCIDTWLGSHSSCPSCRQILEDNRCRNCGHFSNTTNPSSSSISSSFSSTADGSASHKLKPSENPSNSNRSYCTNHHSKSHANSGSFLP